MCICVGVDVHDFVYILGRKLTNRQRELLEEFVGTEDANGTANKSGKMGADVTSCLVNVIIW